MTKPTTKEPLRGDAAWKAAKKAVSDRNEAAYARGRRDKVSRNAEHAAKRFAEERQSNQNLPSQPHDG